MSFSIDAPSESDPAFLDARIRKRICKDIGDSGFFHWVPLVPFDTVSSPDERNHPLSLEIFHQIYTFSPTESAPDNYEYTNLYKPKEFNVLDLYNCVEHVFICLFLHPGAIDNYLLLFYVSQEYNVGPLGRWYKPGRFVFGSETVTLSPSFISLAEEPAIAYMEEGFNVELHYLQKRRYIQPGK